MNHRLLAGLRPMARVRDALLAVLVLNAVVLPCAMAVGLDDHNCPHAAPAERQEMAAHHGHHEPVEANAASGHGCADKACCDVEAACIDSRSGQQQYRDAGDWDSAPVILPAALPLRRGPTLEPDERPPDKPCACPARHKLFCVYLD